MVASCHGTVVTVSVVGTFGGAVLNCCSWWSKVKRRFARFALLGTQ
jgi:hypothetical protein